MAGTGPWKEARALELEAGDRRMRRPLGSSHMLSLTPSLALDPDGAGRAGPSALGSVLVLLVMES